MPEYHDPPDPDKHGCRHLSSNPNETHDRLRAQLDMGEWLAVHWRRVTNGVRSHAFSDQGDLQSVHRVHGASFEQLMSLDPRYPDGEYPDVLHVLEREPETEFLGWYALPIGVVIRV